MPITYHDVSASAETLALAGLSDVTGKTGTGTSVVMDGATSATPAASKIPIADAAGKLDAWLTQMKTFANLVIQNNATNPNYQIDITADVIAIEDVVATSFSKTVDIAVSGANGLDTGAEAISTWYYVFAIAKADGTVASLLSLSSTSPSMPTGYTKKRRIGAVRNNGSSNFLLFVQENNRVNYLDGSFNNRVLSGGTALTATTVSCAGYVPSTSRRIIARNLLSITHGTAGTLIVCRLRQTGSSATEGQCTASLFSQVSGLLVRATVVDDIETNSSQQLDYWLDIAPASGGANIDIFGYYDRI